MKAIQEKVGFAEHEVRQVTQSFSCETNGNMLGELLAQVAEPEAEEIQDAGGVPAVRP